MTFNDFVSKGWNDHVHDSAGVMQRLPEGIDLASDPGHPPQLAALIVHVAGEHLGRWAEGDALLARLLDRGLCPPDSQQCRAIWRSRAILAHCDGDRQREDELMARAGSQPSDRIRLLATASSALLGQKRVNEAMRDFQEALALASYGPGKDDPAASALAVTGNNIACDLELRADRTAEETAMMLEAARAGRKYWEISGTWENVERAEYRLSAAHCAAGDGAAALEHARACLAICTEHSAPGLELCFAHERIAYACQLLGDRSAARDARDAALASVETIEDEGDRDYCRGEIAKLTKVLEG
ncbi:MAG: hypothetical protein U0166_26175 [Acidobacteriota bacterium]